MSPNFAADILKQVTEYVHYAAFPRALTQKLIHFATIYVNGSAISFELVYFGCRQMDIDL